MARKRRGAEAEETPAPAWMCSYGDLVTNMLTFFVLLFSFSTIDVEKWKAVAQSFAGEHAASIVSIGPGDVENDFMTGEGPAPTEKEEEDEQHQQEGGNTAAQKERFDELYEKISKHIEQNNLESLVNVERQDGVTLIRMSDSALFDSGKDVLKAEAKEILGAICGIIEEYEDLIRTIRVEGHTDNVPINTAQFKDNWELSTARALEVVWFVLSITEFNPAKMTPVGYGEYHPVAGNETAEGRTRNRRVDFVLESILSE